jgi:hypothetical protein
VFEELKCIQNLQVSEMTSTELPSRELVEGPSRAPARAMLHAAGFGSSALAKPLIAIVHSFSTVTPCMLDGLGVTTGVDLNSLLDVVAFIDHELGIAPRSRVYAARDPHRT